MFSFYKQSKETTTNIKQTFTNKNQEIFSERCMYLGSSLITLYVLANQRLHMSKHTEKGISEEAFAFEGVLMV